MFEGGHRLRALEPADAAQLYGWENRPEDWWVGARLAPIAHEALLRYATTDTDPFAEGSVRLVLEAPDGTAVGAVDLYAIDARSGKSGVGILVDARRRGEGHGAAGLRLLTDYAAGHLGLRTLFAEVPAGHAASLALFRSAGFEDRGVWKAWVRNGTAFLDVHLLQWMPTAP
jgi:diamine N-acetyltransferase